MASTQTRRIGIIISSTRRPRVCPQVAQFVLDTLTTHLTQLSKSNPNPSTSLHLIDLQDWYLPLFDEPVIPQAITNPADYHHEHTRAWSKEISSYDAFVFVSPQYNWGYPAVLKNAIDFLFNEWTKKSAMIVTYGGHGGVYCAPQLKQVLMGLRMKPVEAMPALAFGSNEVKFKAFAGEDLALPKTGADGLWASEREAIVKAFDDLLASMNAAPPA